VKNMLQCKFCNQKPAVKKSHIVPEFMYKPVYDEKHKLVVADKELEELGERQKGYYEPLLCKDCEKYFNDNFEMPCVKFVRNIPEHSSLDSILCFDPTPEIGLLLLSIVWRASHASGKHWQGVNLGAHQNTIKKSLESKIFNPSYEVWVFLVAHDNGKIEKGIVSSVQRLKANGHNLYHFIASGAQFVVKVSSHKLNKVRPVPIQIKEKIYVQVLGIKKAPSLRQMFI